MTDRESRRSPGARISTVPALRLWPTAVRHVSGCAECRTGTGWSGVELALLLPLLLLLLLPPETLVGLYLLLHNKITQQAP